MRSLIPALAAIVVLGAAALAAAPVSAQSLSPMVKDGVTPSATKGFRLNVGNPYKIKMTFIITPMNSDFTAPVTGAKVKPQRVTMAPGHTRPVLFTFDIDPANRERTIGLCITPENLDGPIQPRVCGRYTGRMLKRK